MLPEAIRDAGAGGLTLTEQSAVISHNRTSAELTAARTDLEEHHLIATTQMPASKGRPAHRSVAI